MAFSSPVSLGNRVIVGVSVFPSTVTVTAVTDNGTTPNTYSNDNPNQSNAAVGTLNTRSANVATNPGAGNLQVTVTFSGTATGGDIYIAEVSNTTVAASPVDTSGTKLDTSGTATALSCTSSTSSGAPGEYVFGIFGVSGNPSSWAGGSGTTLDDSDITNGSAACHKISAGTGTETVNLTIGNGNSYLGQVTLYLPVAVPAGSWTPPEGVRRSSVRMFRMVHRRRANQLDTPAPTVLPISGADDTATADDSGPMVGPQVADTSAGADAPVQTALSAADVSAGADAISTVGLSAADTASAAEGTAIAQLTPVSGADTATGADGVTSIGLSRAETATAADAAGPLGLSGADTASGADAPSLVALSAADTAVGTDNGTAVDLGANNKSGADTAGATDAATLLALSAADTATGANAVTSLGLSRGDTASGSEAVGPVGLVVSDAATAVDGSSVLVQGAAAPTGLQERRGGSRTATGAAGGRPTVAAGGGRLVGSGSGRLRGT